MRGLRRLKRVPPAPSLTPLNWIVEYFTFLTPTADADAYTPGVFDGRITYFVSEASREPHDYDWRLGWHRHTTGGISVVGVPGDHGSMLLEPAVHTTVARFKTELLRAQARQRSHGKEPTRCP